MKKLTTPIHQNIQEKRQEEDVEILQELVSQLFHLIKDLIKDQIMLIIMLHTWSAAAGTPSLHPNPEGWSAPDEVLQNTPTTESRDFNPWTHFLLHTFLTRSLTFSPECVLMVKMSQNQCFVMRCMYGTSLFCGHIKARRAAWSGSFISHERCLY